MPENPDLVLSDLMKGGVWGFNATSGKWKPVKVNDAGELVTTAGAGGGGVDPVRIHDGTDILQIDASGRPTVNVNGAVPVTDNGGSLTVDGTVGISGTVATDPTDDATRDNGRVRIWDGTDIAAVNALGSLEVSITTNPVPVSDGGNVLSVDDAGSTLSVDDGAGSLTVDGTVAVSNIVRDQGAAAAVSSAWPIKIVDSGGVNVAAVNASNQLQVRAILRNSANGDISGQATSPAGTENGLNAWARQMPATLVVVQKGAAGAATTLTIAAAGAGLFHYITKIVLERIHSNATASTAVADQSWTTTNLPGSLTFSMLGGAFPATAGQFEERQFDFSAAPLKSSAANTATTIVSPALQANVIWKATVYYYTGN